MEHSQARPITQKERCIIEYLISSAKAAPKQLAIPEKVYTLDDGGMGSIRFIGADGEKRYGGDLVEAEYIDTDGILVVIALQLNLQDELLDLDFWKVDFSPLLQYPKPEQLRIIEM